MAKSRSISTEEIDAIPEIIRLGKFAIFTSMLKKPGDENLIYYAVRRFYRDTNDARVLDLFDHLFKHKFLNREQLFAEISLLIYLEPDNRTDLILFALGRLPEKTIWQLLCADAKYNVCTLNVLQKLAPEHRDVIFSQVLALAIEKYNVGLIIKLRQSYPVNFAKGFFTLPELEQHKINYLLSLDDPARERITKRMAEFANGFGLITYQGGLLTCAQISTRKSTYTFNPTLMRQEDLAEYLKMVNASARPLRERFIITGTHWMCGDIQIDSNGKVNILLIDPIGIMPDYPNEPVQDRMYDGAVSAIKTCKEIFPEATLYFPHKPRQKSAKGCSVFVLDDTRHLYTTENYLEEKYKSTGLFGYLAEANPVPVVINGDTIITCHLPLAFERTMQSRALLEKVIPGRSAIEQTIPVNKKGETALAASIHGFHKPAETEVAMNMRLTNKLNNMSNMNFQYLMRTDEHEIQTRMSTFTLNAFKDRLNRSLDRAQRNPGNK